MNNSTFYTIRPKKGDVMWMLPMRWWETDEPSKVSVLTDCGENDRNLYVMSAEYGHEVYIERAFVTYKKETIVEIIKHLRALKDLMEDDGMDTLMNRIFRNG